MKNSTTKRFREKSPPKKVPALLKEKLSICFVTPQSLFTSSQPSIPLYSVVLPPTRNLVEFFLLPFDFTIFHFGSAISERKTIGRFVLGLTCLGQTNMFNLNPQGELAACIAIDAKPAVANAIA